MLKTIDVVFICPKHHCLIVWHDKLWWQLPRMHLTQGSWERRLPYMGNLEDIFVARHQEGEVESLRFFDLPSELFGISASKFLAWWQFNRYGFQAKINEQDSDSYEPTLLTTPIATPNSSADCPHTTSNQTSDDLAHTPGRSPESLPRDTPSNSLPTPPNDVPNMVLHTSATEHSPITQSSPIPNTSHLMQPTSAKSTTAEHPPVETLSGMDIFDALLEDLSEDIIHDTQGLHEQSP